MDMILVAVLSAVVGAMLEYLASYKRKNGSVIFYGNDRRNDE